jgi:hypothetical protein
MHAVHFRKDYAAKVMTALTVGLPIPAPPEGWTEDAMLMVAGVVTAELRKKPPHTWDRVGGEEQRFTGLAPEARELEEPDHVGDIFLGMNLVSDTVDRLSAGRFDGAFTPEFRAAVYCRADVNRAVTMIEGRAAGLNDPIPAATPPEKANAAPQRGRARRGKVA